jgi:hypothetical protein
MPIKIKEKEGFKVSVRCGNPMELRWFLTSMAEWKMMGKTPIASVKDIKGEEIKLIPRTDMQKAIVVDAKQTEEQKPVIIDPSKPLIVEQPKIEVTPTNTSAEYVGVKTGGA